MQESKLKIEKNKYLNKARIEERLQQLFQCEQDGTRYQGLKEVLINRQYDISNEKGISHLYQLLGEEQLNVLFEIGILIAYWNTCIFFTFSDNSVDRQKLEIKKKKIEAHWLKA